MNYKKVKKNIFASGTVPDGYFGATQGVDFSLINQKIIMVAKCGCYCAGLPDVIDKKEAVWILKNHPSSNHIKNVK